MERVLTFAYDIGSYAFGAPAFIARLRVRTATAETTAPFSPWPRKEMVPTRITTAQRH